MWVVCRRLMVALIYLGIILVTVGIAYGQDVVQGYKTGLNQFCNGNEIAFASLSTRINDNVGERASALCLVLLPAGGEAVDKMFCLYKFDNGQINRDSDEWGDNKILPYKAANLTSNLKKYFMSLNCAVDERLLAILSGEMRENISLGDPSARELAYRITGVGGPAPSRLPVESLRPLTPATSAEVFPSTVHRHFEKIGSIRSTPGAPTPTIENPKKPKAPTPDPGPTKETISLGDYLSFCIILILIVIGVIFILIYSKLVRAIKEQIRITKGKEDIREEIYSSLIQKLHSNNQTPSATSESFENKLLAFEQQLSSFDADWKNSPSPDEGEMRQLIPNLFKKKLDALLSIHAGESKKKAKKRGKTYEELISIVDSYLTDYLALRKHRDEVVDEYSKLCHSFYQDTSDFFLGNSVNPNNMGREEINSGEETGHSNSEASPPLIQGLTDRMKSLESLIQKQNTHDNELNELKDGISKAEKFLRDQALLKESEEFFDCVRRMASEQKKALDMLPEYQSQDIKSISGKMREIDLRLSSASDAIGWEIPEARDETIDLLVNKVLGELRQATLEVKANKELSGALVPYLGFNPQTVSSGQASQTILKVVNTESPEFQELRFRLRAVQIALDRATNLPDHERILKALRIDNWQPGLNTFLHKMQDIKENELWTEGLRREFAEDWLHLLLRAEWLMNAYFSDNEFYFLLRDAVCQAGRAIAAATHHCGVKLSEVKLFGLPFGKMQADAEADDSLIQLPEVRAKILQKFNESKLAKFIVDVKGFPIDAGDARNNGRVVIMNPADWLHPLERVKN